MNYRKVYMTIIVNAIKENRKKLSRDAENYVYYEEHHVLPKSLFPAWKNRKSNLVLLTAREHFFCHQLLTKIYPSYAMSCALFYMCNGNKHQRFVCSSRDYERARIDFSKWNSIMRKGQDPWNKDISYKDLYTDEERKLRFGKNKGRKCSKEEIEKRSQSLRGKKRTDEQLEHYREASKKRAARLKANGMSKSVGQINKLKRSKSIFCPELNIIFSSHKEAAEYFHTSECRIAEQIKRIKQGKLYRRKYSILEVSKEG